MQLADRYGLTGASAMARRKAGLPPMTTGGSGDSDVNAAPSQAVGIEEVEGPDCIKDLFTTEVDLCRGSTTVDQRLSQADTQPTTMADVYPRHKHLVVKR